MHLGKPRRVFCIYVIGILCPIISPAKEFIHVRLGEDIHDTAHNDEEKNVHS